MTTRSPVERMKDLNDLLKHHAWAYHVKDAPEISNLEYDNYEREFRGLCEEYPELAMQFEAHTKAVPIEDPKGDDLEIVQSENKMLSLKKFNSWEEYEEFKKELPEGTEIFHEVKIDGLAIKLIYNKGQFSKMVTRGSGMVGEDVTHARVLLDSSSIPDHVDNEDEELEFNGEVYITMHDYQVYQDSVTEKKKDPRNAVAGWVRRNLENLDHKVLGVLHFAAYSSTSDFGCKTYEEKRRKFQNMGFYVPPESSETCIKENMRSQLIPCDGIVFKVNDLVLQKEMGNATRHPRWAGAYKFPPEERFPSVEDVEWNTSAFGRVVPVVKYSPVFIGGVCCTNASLDNYGRFMDLGLGPGDVVSMTRNNDVIPRLNHVTEMGDREPFVAPTECPSCSSVLEIRIGKTGTDLVCNNSSGCPAQLIGRCVYMGDKFGFDIDGWGPAIVADLVERGIVKQPADVFTLSQVGKNLVSASLLANIEKARDQPLSRFIKGMGLPDIGVVLSTRIANAMTSPQNGFAAEMIASYASSDKDLFKALFETLLSKVSFLNSVYGISNGIAMSVVRSMENPTFLDNVDKLIDETNIDFTPQRETGFKVCVTGALDQSRDVLKDYFAQHGIELNDRLTSDCKYLITGERPSKSKMLKATELDIPMLDVNEYASVERLINFITKES